MQQLVGGASNESYASLLSSKKSDSPHSAIVSITLNDVSVKQEYKEKIYAYDDCCHEDIMPADCVDWVRCRGRWIGFTHTSIHGVQSNCWYVWAVQCFCTGFVTDILTIVPVSACKPFQFVNWTHNTIGLTPTIYCTYVQCAWLSRKWEEKEATDN